MQLLDFRRLGAGVRLRRRRLVLSQDESLATIPPAHREQLAVATREPKAQRRVLLLLQPGEAGELQRAVGGGGGLVFERVTLAHLPLLVEPLPALLLIGGRLRRLAL